MTAAAIKLLKSALRHQQPDYRKVNKSLRTMNFTILVQFAGTVMHTRVRITQAAARATSQRAATSVF